MMRSFKSQPQPSTESMLDYIQDVWKRIWQLKAKARFIKLDEKFATNTKIVISLVKYYISFLI